MSPTSGALMILSEMLSKLPPSERKIAEFIIKNPNETISLTAAKLGEQSNTSSAAVIRLCKSLGFKGFQQLKLRIAGDLQKNGGEGYSDIQPGESQSEVLTKMTNNSIQTLKETMEIIDQEELSKAVDAIVEGENLHFFGVGASNIIAQDAQLKFSRINKRATANSDFHLAAMQVANVSEKDVVFGISFSGNTYEVERILALANSKGATTVSISKFGPSPVAEAADISLYTSISKEATFRSGATSSRLAQLHVIDILFICVANKSYNEVMTHLSETREAVKFIQGKRHKSSRRGERIDD
ncbi:DNA-binding MurR/RpiR family transcriptional regulator [Evansella vedderi]|uniref:DNA-binding MurR/RpiR family transcriptional regulator n=1 Tax=Evansella vedderi TaxID=38282 RepID=A0ABT9ZZI6_9BACI|nr:MurR/RpiR family transcriptional regulator [Evansella vedderi]MDQ0256648.1 DNA-binding MurR/RpiR family transcriptional regulator [Evansella vedderi]